MVTEPCRSEEFIAELSKVAEEDRMYLDESGMDNRVQYDYGWNEKGGRFHALRSGKREGRINRIAVLCEQKLFAPFTIEGA